MTRRVTIAAVLQLDLPGHTVRLVDGGTLPFAGQTFGARDDVIGVPATYEALTDGLADEAPAGAITFLPPAGVAAATLLAPAWQGARCRLWITDVDDTTGLPVGEPDQIADWMLDQSQLTTGRAKRELELTFVGAAERLFQSNRGNSLSPLFHRSIYPGEAGLDGASGVTMSVAWGAPAAPRGTVAAGGGGDGGGGTFNVDAAL